MKNVVLGQNVAFWIGIVGISALCLIPVVLVIVEPTVYSFADLKVLFIVYIVSVCLAFSFTSVIIFKEDTITFWYVYKKKRVIRREDIDKIIQTAVRGKQDCYIILTNESVKSYPKTPKFLLKWTTCNGKEFFVFRIKKSERLIKKFWHEEIEEFSYSDL